MISRTRKGFSAAIKKNDRLGAMSAQAALCRHAIASVVLLNVIFFLLVSLVAALSTSIFVTRVREAFSTGQLNPQVDYAWYDSRTGNHQYNDCLILQMLISPGENWLRRALGPRIYFQQDYLNSCETLYRLTHDSEAARTLPSFRYTRYWHGFYPISGLLLSWFDLKFVRIVLKGFLYFALISLPFVGGFLNPSISFLAASVALTGLFFWAVPYYGQSLCHGPGDAMVIFGFALFLLLRRWTSTLRGMILFSAAFGACLTFMEFFTGLLPTGASLLFISAFLLHDQTTTAQGRFHSLKFAFLSVASFAAASLLTVILKQTLAAIVIGPETIIAFTGSLANYSASADTGAARLSITWEALNKVIFTSSDVLTHGNIRAAHALLALSASAWSAAILFTLINRRNGSALTQMAAFLISVGIIVSWIALLPNHTIKHAFFMSRMLLIPISLGWAALLCQLLAFENRR